MRCVGVVPLLLLFSLMCVVVINWVVQGFDEEVEATLRLADSDGDGVISLQDFQEAVHTELRDDIDLFESRLAREHEHRP